jgi:DNA-binding CsgD family transcriptional regulator
VSSAVELIERAGRAGSVRELFAAASARLRRLLPHDAAVWMATDPATILPTAPTRAENLGDFGGREACVRLWELEFLVEDVNRARPHAAGAAGRPPLDRGPGLMVFDATGELVSMNDDALAWLDELAGDIGGDDRFGVRLPMTVLSTLMRARAIAAARDSGTARARLRSGASDRWLVCHASCLRDADGTIGDTALVIEPAAPAEIAPLVTQAYDLTPRERQITQLIARGHGTGEIAARLHLSAHTVRDYVKAIFEKAGVSSRGELVATLFAEHYAPLHLDPNGLDAVEDDLADRVEGSASRGRVR